MIDRINKFWGILPQHQVADKFTGYEHLYDQLDKITVDDYTCSPDATIERVFELYRSVNLVPITYYTEQGLKSEISSFRKSTYNGVKNQTLGLGNNAGQSINRFIFTNMMTAEPKGRGSNSLRDRFYNDAKLRRAIRICFEFRSGDKILYPQYIRTALELVTGENVTNFKAQNARAIAEYLNTGMFSRVYDYSCGYGGRLLGIGSSNMHYTYIGVDPNTETYDYLIYLNELLGNHHEIHKLTSQEFQPENIDLAFSSPPYFNLEKYSDEPTQCMVQFTTLDEWFDGYVVPTMKNIHKGLNDDGIFATNIADYKSYGNKEYQVVDRWISTAEKLGFKHSGTIKMMLTTRPGVGNDRKQGREKSEGVYFFKKTNQ